MNLLITNAVPLNGGDEALLRATIESLIQNHPHCSITTLCKDVDTVRQRLTDLQFESDLEFASEAGLEQVARQYHTADLVLSAPGGFLHDFYSIEPRLRGLEFALALGKPVVLLGQSIGPFWKPESLRRIPQVLNRVARICVRDAVSRQELLKVGVQSDKIQETADMAFLWRRLAPDLFQSRARPVRRIGVCFRTWPPGDAQAETRMLSKAVTLCHALLQPPDRELVFLSTCQGIAGYVDDSVLATRIAARLPAELQPRCRIIRERLGPTALIKNFAGCDAFVGMRLHGCILSMLGGTPAMGLGYENKTREIFSQLGLQPFQVHFESDVSEWLACAEHFLTQVDVIRSGLLARLEQACRRAELNLAVVAAECRALEQKNTGAVPTASPLPPSESLLALARRYSATAGSLADAVERLIPPTSDFILVDDMHCAGQFPGRSPIPFLEKAGVYWGTPPDDARAISELDRLRQAGADFVVFAWPSFWWLDTYPDFARHLRANFPCLLANEHWIVFDLRC